MIRATFKQGEMKLSFQGEGEELTTRLVREKTNGVMEGMQEKTVMQLMEGERGIVLKGIKERRKKYQNMQTRFAENSWTIMVSQKILAKYYA